MIKTKTEKNRGENKMKIKYTGTFNKDFVRTEVIEFEEISKAKAIQKMRDMLKDRTEEGVVANLFEIHRADADLIVKWKVDSNLIISESFKI
jgi:hypothetical protein